MATEYESLLGTDRFKIRRLLGSGGTGLVFEAFDVKYGQPVALKLVTQLDPRRLRLFKNEFRALSGVGHPNLITLYELISLEDRCFFTMELIDGVDFLAYAASATGDSAGPTPRSTFSPTTLQEGATPSSLPFTHTWTTSSRLATPTSSSGDGAPVPPAPRPAARFDEQRLRSALRQLAQGLAALHAGGRLHRDIKPSNVLVTGDGRVVLLDFGLTTEFSSRPITVDSPVAGTPEYMSPEQMLGRDLSPASDCYAVGVMLYEVLTGRLPFMSLAHPTRAGWHALLDLKTAQPPPAPRLLVPSVPADLDALCVELLHPEAAVRPSAQDVLGRLTGETRRPSPAQPVAVAAPSRFHGRARHLAVLAQSFAEAAEGRTVVVRVHGPAGIGKSRLVQHFLDGLARDHRAIVREGRCYERELLRYKAFDSLVDGLSRHLERLSPDEVRKLLPPSVGALARVFPVLKRVTAVAEVATGDASPASAADDPHHLRRSAFAAFRALLQQIAAGRPLVLFIDDLQWGDLDSAALLADLVNAPYQGSLLLILSHRDDDPATENAARIIPGEVAEGVRRHDLLVDPLDPEETLALARSLVSERLHAQREIIARESGGSPLLVQELAHLLGETPDAAEVAGHLGHLNLGSLAEILAARLELLPAPQRLLLELVAVSGRALRESTLTAAAALGDQLAPGLAGLRARHLVRVRGTPEGRQVDSAHDRIREVVAAALDPTRARERHRRLADALESDGGRDAEALFVHLQEAGDAARAAAYAVTAARAAAGTLAFDRASMFFRRALDLRGPDHPERDQLAQELAATLADAGRCQEAANGYLDVASRADRPASLRLRLRAAELLLVSGHVDQGLEVVSQILAAVHMTMAKTPGRALLSLLVRRVVLAARGFRVPTFAAAVSSERALSMDACWALAVGLSVIDNVRAADFQTRYLIMALKCGDLPGISKGLAMEAAFRATAGVKALPRATKILQQAKGLARQIDHPYPLALSTLTDGITQYLSGRWADAFALCERAEQALRHAGGSAIWELTSAHRFADAALLFLGRIGELTTRLVEQLETARDRGNLYAATDLCTRFNVVWLAQDRPDEAERQLTWAMERWSAGGFHLQHYNSLLARTQLALYRRPAEAWQVIEASWPALRRSLLQRIQVLRVEARHLRARAALALSLSSSPEKPSGGRLLAVVRRACEQIEAERLPWATPMAGLLRAALACAAGDPGGAAARLEAAAAGFDAAGMGLFAAVARRRQGELGAGSAEGAALVAAADQAMRAEGIRRPAAMAAMLAPGFPASPLEGDGP